jgi:hypothetical protein
MNRSVHPFGDCRIELLTRRGTFLGIGRAWIGKRLVRSGRLAMQCFTQSFSGLESGSFRLLRIDARRSELRIRTEVLFRRLPIVQMRDHSFDPIHDLTDWDASAPAGTGRIDLVFRPTTDTFGEARFHGFAYHWEYRGDVPIYWLLDRSSWELDGDITGATAYSQSACSPPVATFNRSNSWSTEGRLWIDAPDLVNRVMTHNLPRWASHGSFDFQFKPGRTLIGVYERVGLIRSVLLREPGALELKTFDKHVIDETTNISTPPKMILLNEGSRGEIDGQNLWTAIERETGRRARAEFGIREEPPIPRVSWNYWRDFTIESYYQDLLPAAAAVGARQIFIDNLNKSDMSEGTDKVTGGNMCCGHEYETASSLGGPEALRKFVRRCRELGIQPMQWTNTDQSTCSPLNNHVTGRWDWFVKMEDTRMKHGGGHNTVASLLDFSNPEPRQYWVRCLKKIKRTTGLDGFFFDSFYNFSFMPVTYASGHPRTMWRQTLAAMKELQDAGIHFLIESFGPWGQPQHSCHPAYGMKTLFACYRIDVQCNDANELYRALAHQAMPRMPLWIGKTRIDHAWTPHHRRALADYHAALPHLKHRTIEPGDAGVRWLDNTGRRMTIFNFRKRRVPMAGRVFDLTTSQPVPRAEMYALEPMHTYLIDQGSRRR